MSPEEGRDVDICSPLRRCPMRPWHRGLTSHRAASRASSGPALTSAAGPGVPGGAFTGRALALPPPSTRRPAREHHHCFATSFQISSLFPLGSLTICEDYKPSTQRQWWLLKPELLPSFPAPQQNAIPLICSASSCQKQRFASVSAILFL